MRWRREWALRCLHEKRLHSASAFLTLTYADEWLPSPPSLSLRDLQLFMKRLRKARPDGLRFFACGEYGDITKRPHYHVLLFNTRFQDQRFYKYTPGGDPLYRSVELSELWTYGNADIGTVTAKTCAYVAGYVMKKVGQSEIPSPGYEREFRVMSRRPGIGAGWFDRFQDEAYRADSAIIDGREVGLPRYYDSKYGLVDAEDLKRIKLERWKKRWLNPEDKTKSRLMVREAVDILNANRFKREA
jgi:hypothetical protein